MTAERIDPRTFRILIGASHFEIRHLGATLTGGTDLDVGRHLEPSEIRERADHVGRLPELTAMLQPAPREIRIGDDRRGGGERE